MTATIVLVRHAAHAQLGHVLSGRTPGVALSAEGRAQAKRLARRLARVEISRVQASPVQRAQETALAIAGSRPGMIVETVAALEELDFGDWTGRTFAELHEDPRWRTWNSERATASLPCGETMAQAQDRAWRHIERTARENDGRTVAMVSHCDLIRAVVAGVLNLSLDHFDRFDIAPASISRIAVGDWGAKLLGLNEECHE